MIKYHLLILIRKIVSKNVYKIIEIVCCILYRKLEASSCKTFNIDEIVQHLKTLLIILCTFYITYKTY